MERAPLGDQPTFRQGAQGELHDTHDAGCVG